LFWLSGYSAGLKNRRAIMQVAEATVWPKAQLAK
jgi:hypothetical protein